jgi:hypothetical protein
MAAFGSNDSCPNCGARMAADQRYCLNCGHRRGEPRLPFMDAVVFMESMSGPGGTAGSPPPPPPAQSGGSAGRWNANAALIAGVATLVLAIGVGFLIGRSGHENNAPAGGGEVKVVQIGGAGETATGAESTETTGGAKTGNEANSGGKAAGKGAKPKPSEVKENSKEEEKLAEEKTAEVLHSKVKSVKPTAELGESCEKGVAGCSSNGKFEGEFFE